MQNTPANTDWVRLRAALEASLELAPEQRSSALAKSLQDVPELLAMGRDMLAMDEGDGHKTPLEGKRTSPLRIGPYLTQRTIASGGMGTVYLAVRDDGEFRQQVAIKVIRPHMDTEEVLARFRRERQVQAGLSHPCIVRLLDGGATEDGLPYLVMEYVEGVRIDQYCDQNRLSIEERIGLFRNIVQAVEHAHEQRVVHRDIKPSNILVATDGSPKLLDFGIAKVLDTEKQAQDGEVTRESLSFLTPGYASPEQLRGESVTRASDLYSLGALLHLLLVGQPPHDLSGLSLAEAQLRVSTDPVPRASLTTKRRLSAPQTEDEPSAEVIASARDSTPRGLVRDLRGDLERILAMALRHEPLRRYASAAALDEDLTRHLSGRPILARPDGVIYRSGKFLARNRGVCTAIGGAFLVLLGSLTYSQIQNQRISRAHTAMTEQRDLADKRLVRLRRLSSDMVMEVQLLYQAVPEALDRAENIMRVLEHHADQAANLVTDDIRALCDIGELYIALGETRYSSRTAHLGKRDEALATYERALGVLKRAHDLDPTHSRSAKLAGRALEQVATIRVGEGDLAAAVKVQNRALELLAPLNPDSETVDELLVVRWCTAHDSLARVLMSLGRFEDAMHHAQTNLECWQRYYAQKPAAQVMQRGQIAIAELLLGLIHNRMGDDTKAMSILDDVEQDLRGVVAAHIGTSDGTRSWVQAAREKAEAMHALSLPGSFELLDKVIDLLRAAKERAPNDLRMQGDLVLVLLQRTKHELASGRDTAEDWALETLELATSVDAMWTGLAKNQTNLARASIYLGMLRHRQGSLAEAAELIGSGTRTLRAVVEASPQFWGTRIIYDEALLERAKLQVTIADGAALRDVQRSALLRAQKYVQTVLDNATKDKQTGIGGTVSVGFSNRARDLKARILARLEELP